MTMKPAGIDHPKTKALARNLGITRRDAVGLLEMLWNWTAHYAPEGDIGRWSDAEIAAAVDWDKNPQVLIDALLKPPDNTGQHCGFLVRMARARLVINDWNEHAPDYIKRRDREGEIELFISKSLKIKRSRHQKKPAKDQNFPDGSPKKSGPPLPSLSSPSLTKPPLKKEGEERAPARAGGGETLSGFLEEGKKTLSVQDCRPPEKTPEPDPPMTDSDIAWKHFLDTRSPAGGSVMDHARCTNVVAVHGLPAVIAAIDRIETTQFTKIEWALNDKREPKTGSPRDVLSEEEKRLCRL